MARAGSPETRGFALPLVLGVLALGGMLVTASFLLGRLESQSAENDLRASRAFETAETGLASTLTSWDPLLDTLPIGGTASLAGAGVATASWHSTIQRLGEDLFFLRSEGIVPIAGVTWQAERQLSWLLRWAAPLPQPSAVAVIDSVSWNGAGSASGYSGSSPGWPFCGPDSMPALRIMAATVVGLSGCGGPSCLRGMPPILADTALAGSVSAAIAPLTYAALAARATRAPGGIVASVGPTLAGVPPACDASDPLNWGEPDHASPGPCTGLMPVIHASGDLTIGGGRGQGVLLVDGDLILGGGFDFFGLVVVQGRLTSGAGGAHITGAVAARSLNIPPAGRIDVDYSACVLRNVLRGPSQVTPLLYRSWAQLY
ncbi:MAG: hypothetical protein ABI836_06485 [Gemmatimonadota bacterium]